MTRRDPPPRRDQVRASTSPSTTWPARRSACPSTSCSGSAGQIPPTDFTLGLDAPAVVAERARRAARFPALKIKVGGPPDLATLEAVRAVFDGPIRVDANTGWTPEVAVALAAGARRAWASSSSSSRSRRGACDWLRDLQERSPLPIVADECAVTIEDLDALVGRRRRAST